MQNFNPNYQNPIIPSDSSGLSINISTATSPINLVLWNAFQIGEYPFSAVINLIEDAGLIPSTFEIFMPGAQPLARWAGTIINNTTSIGIPIKTSLGEEILMIAPGKAYIIFLIDNETSNGIWLPLAFGEGVSPAIAAALAGNGLRAILNTLNVVTNISTISSPTVITADNGFSMINYTGGTATQALPAPPFPGFSFFIKNSSPANGILTVAPVSPSTVDSGASVNLFYNEGAYFVTDGTNWFTVGVYNLQTQGVELTASGIKVINGSASNPSYSFIDYPNTGFFTTVANIIGITVNGSKIAEFTSQGINITNGNVFVDNIPINLVNAFYP